MNYSSNCYRYNPYPQYIEDARNLLSHQDRQATYSELDQRLDAWDGSEFPLGLTLQLEEEAVIHFPPLLPVVHQEQQQYQQQYQQHQFLNYQFPQPKVQQEQRPVNSPNRGRRYSQPATTTVVPPEIVIVPDNEEEEQPDYSSSRNLSPNKKKNTNRSHCSYIFSRDGSRRRSIFMYSFK